MIDRGMIDSSVSSKSLESLTERCESALLLLEEAQHSMESAPLPDSIQVRLVLLILMQLCDKSSKVNGRTHWCWRGVRCPGCSLQHWQTPAAHGQHSGWPAHHRAAAERRSLAGRADQFLSRTSTEITRLQVPAYYNDSILDQVFVQKTDCWSSLSVILLQLWLQTFIGLRCAMSH